MEAYEEELHWRSIDHVIRVQCCHNFFGNFLIARLCYPKILATKNPNKIQTTIS